MSRCIRRMAATYLECSTLTRRLVKWSPTFTTNLAILSTNTTTRTPTRVSVAGFSLTFSLLKDVELSSKRVCIAECFASKSCD